MTSHFGEKDQTSRNKPLKCTRHKATPVWRNGPAVAAMLAPQVQLPVVDVQARLGVSPVKDGSPFHGLKIHPHSFILVSTSTLYYVRLYH